MTARRRRIRRQPPEQPAVDGDVDDDGEEHHLDRRDSRPCAAAPAQPAEQRGGDDRRREDRRRPDPRDGGEQRAAAGGRSARGRFAHAQREQRRARDERRARRRRADRRRGQHGGRREPDGERRAHRPRVRHEPPPERGRCGEPAGGDQREEQLDGDRAAERVGGSEQQRERETLRLDQPPVDRQRRRGQPAAVERLPRRAAVLVGELEVSAVDDRLGREQDVGLAGAQVRAARRVQAEPGAVDREQHDEDDQRRAARPAPPHPCQPPELERRVVARVGRRGHRRGAGAALRLRGRGR